MPLPIEAAFEHAPPGPRDPFRYWDPWYEKDPGWSLGDLNKARAAAAKDPAMVPTAETVFARLAKNTAVFRGHGPPIYTAALVQGVDGVRDAVLAGIAKLEAENAAVRADAKKRAEEYFGYFGYGAYGKWAAETATKIADGILSALGGGAGHPEIIRTNLEKAADCYVDCVKQLMPPPLQNLGFTTLDNEYWQDTEKLAHAGCAYRDKMQALPAEARERIGAWWALVTKNIKHPAVRDMLLYTSWGQLGLAQDAQVWIVAVPVAVEMGIDPETFARRLWNGSAGWQGAPAEWRQFEEDGWVNNAAALQWDVLVTDAFRLAGVGAEAPKKASPAPLIGLLGTVGLVALGAPLALALAPLAVGLFWGRSGSTVGSHERSVVTSGCGCKRRHRR